MDIAMNNVQSIGHLSQVLCGRTGEQGLGVLRMNGKPDDLQAHLVA